MCIPANDRRCPQSYQPDALVSFDYEGIYLGFANVIGFSTNRSLSPAGGGTVNAELCFSVDGRNWRYLAPGKSFIPLGGAGGWDSCSVFGAKQGFMRSQRRGARNSSMPLYYAGCNGPFMGPRACALGLAHVQRHGWAGMQGTGSGGWIQLAPARVGTGVLLLTVESTGTAGVRVRLKDDPQCTFENSIALIGTLTEVPAAWRGGCDLMAYRGGAVIIELDIAPGATVFAYSLDALAEPAQPLKTDDASSIVEECSDDESAVRVPPVPLEVQSVSVAHVDYPTGDKSFSVMEAFPSDALTAEAVSPFLLCHEWGDPEKRLDGSVAADAGPPSTRDRAKTVGWHPHRGFDLVSCE